MPTSNTAEVVAVVSLLPEQNWHGNSDFIGRRLTGEHTVLLIFLSYGSVYKFRAG